jgi:hypothetical protein
MIRIRVNERTSTDVTDMRAKGWHVLVFRGDSADKDFLVAEKRDVRFVMKIITRDDVKYTEVTKYLDGFVKDTKLFYENDCGITGTFCISEGKDNDSTYAFFRNERLQKIIDEFELRRIVFPKDNGETFEKIVWVDTKYRQYTGEHPVAPNFHTDGTYEMFKDEDGCMKWRVSNATYVYEYQSGTLTIPQKYDTETIRHILTELTEWGPGMK